SILIPHSSIYKLISPNLQVLFLQRHIIARTINSTTVHNTTNPSASQIFNTYPNMPSNYLQVPAADTFAPDATPPSRQQETLNPQGQRAQPETVPTQAQKGKEEYAKTPPWERPRKQRVIPFACAEARTTRPLLRRPCDINDPALDKKARDDDSTLRKAMRERAEKTRSERSGPALVQKDTNQAVDLGKTKTLLRFTEEENK
ncbi:hypothetical protein B0J11DRAFT_597121, partial [Dendryphion nanum]